MEEEQHHHSLAATSLICCTHHRGSLVLSFAEIKGRVPGNLLLKTNEKRLAGEHKEGVEATSLGLVGQDDLLIVGPRILGRIVAEQWRKDIVFCLFEDGFLDHKIRGGHIGDGNGCIAVDTRMKDFSSSNHQQGSNNLIVSLCLLRGTSCRGRNQQQGSNR